MAVLKTVPSTKPRKISFETLSVADLYVDANRQRWLVETWVIALLAMWDPDYLGIPVVSRRKDGSLWVIDGQHRIEVLNRLGVTTVACTVYEGLTLREEAKMFLALNRNRKAPYPYDQYRVGLTAGMRTERRMFQQAQACGLDYGKTASANIIGAVTAARRIVDLDSANHELLRETLGVAETAWGRQADTWSANALQAIGKVIHANRVNIDFKRLARTLTKSPVTLWDSRAIARSRGGGGSESRSDEWTFMIVDEYNHGLRTPSKLIQYPKKPKKIRPNQP